MCSILSETIARSFIYTFGSWYDAVGRAKVSHQLQQCFENWLPVMRHPGKDNMHTLTGNKLKISVHKLNS